jgi:hypothetical protein
MHEAVGAGNAHRRGAAGAQSIAKLTAEAEAPTRGLTRRVERASVQP